jgi:secreted trypsin-like serine protease
VVRADRDDAEYLELATRYPSAISLGAGGGAGVLVSQRWVLTAAHRAKALEASAAPRRVTIAGRAHDVQAIFVHPDWKGGDDADIALLQLARAVDDIVPTPVYRDADEAGKAARIVGFGRAGTIGSPGPRAGGDRKARAAINTVDRVTPRALGLRVKAADEASDLQGAMAPGDGGAPAFFEANGAILVAGIATATDRSHASAIGEWDTYVRVSAFAAWIDDVVGEAGAREAAAVLGDTERR